ncbi:hypothetical protein ACRAWF_16450 [Streptomyces sp. L7]
MTGFRAGHARRPHRHRAGRGRRGLDLRSAVHRGAVGRHPSRGGVHRGLPGALRRGTRPVVRRGVRRRRPDRPIPRHTRDHDHRIKRTGRRGPLPTRTTAWPSRSRFVLGTTHAMDPANTAFLYQARGGAFRFLGRYDQVRAAKT